MLKKMIAKLVKRLPEKTRLQFYRDRAELPSFTLDPDFTVEIARSQHDLEKAFQLLHDAYVGSKLMNPHASGLRCNLYTFLPHTTVIIAKYKREVVGTVSLIRDSIWGLPSDKDYRAENDKLRSAGKKCVEVSALAVSREYRQRGNAVSLLLMKYLYTYSTDYLSLDSLVCTVHPRAEDFYKALWHFDRNGEVVSYGFVQGALAVHLSMPLGPVHLGKIIASYNSNSIHKNLGLYAAQEDDRFKYPSRDHGMKIDPVMTPSLFDYFCIRKSGAWDAFSAVERKSLARIYFGASEVTALQVQSSAEMLPLREYRVPVDILAIVKDQENLRIVKLTDLSERGAFFAWPDNLQDLRESFTLKFKVGEALIEVAAEVAWKNLKPSHLQPQGFGIKFTDVHPALQFQLQSYLGTRAQGTHMHSTKVTAAN